MPPTFCPFVIPRAVSVRGICFFLWKLANSKFLAALGMTTSAFFPHPVEPCPDGLLFRSPRLREASVPREIYAFEVRAFTPAKSSRTVITAE